MKNGRRVEVRLTEEEYQVIRKAMARTGIRRVSEYIRQAALKEARTVDA